MTGQKIYTFRDPAPLARTVVAWLYVHLGAVVLYGLASVLPLLGKTPLIDIVVGLSALPILVVRLVVGFLVLKWIYRMSRNAHSAARGLTISPPWAVGWFFIPVAFLWKPFQGVREAWQASTEAANWKTVPVPSILRTWWALFLVSNFLSQASFRLSLTQGGSDIASAIDAITTFVDAPLDLIFIAIVRELTRKQASYLLAETFGDVAPQPAT
jgi:hypothetical protein